MGFGLQLALYAAGLFGPALIAEFGWTKSQYALPGVLAFVTVFVFPLAGRLTDRLGVRRVAAMGIAGVAAVTVGMGLMTGPYWQFLALSLGKTVFGTMATTAVFTRLVAERFDAARGVALAVVISGPPLIAAGAIPLLDGIIADQGWRTAYFVLGGMILAGGGLALLLAPRTGVNHFRGAARPDSFRADFRRIARRRVFWVLLAAMFLVNMPQV
ncbi:MAG: MFS transporter, partial [Steroidobacteraceae bacterium]